MNNIIKKYLLFFLFCFILVFFDQYSKLAITENLRDGKVITIIKDVIEILYVENTGAAFGILQGRQYFFYVITIIVLCLIIFYIFRLPFTQKYFPLWLSISMLFSGTLGNFIDRVKNKYVVDFIYFKPIDFPVFNIADILITASCILFILLFMFYYKEDDLKFLWK